MGSLFRRIFKKESGEGTEANKSASVKPVDMVEQQNEVSGSASSILKQSNTGPSTMITTPSEKTPQTGPNSVNTNTAVVADQETVMPPNPTQRDVNIDENGITLVSLWDTAYDLLKEEEETRKLLSAYEDLLSRVPIKGDVTSPSAPTWETDASDVENRIPQHDPAARQGKLKEIAKSGLQHMEDKKVKVTILGHEIRLQDGVGQVGEAVDWAQTFIKDAIKDVPYAPAVMAGISLVLPLLKNPAAVDEANRQGFAYVTSQMGYYAEMESLLLPEDMKPGLRADLTTRVLDLYKLIIEFQIRSVVRFYRNSTKNYFRSVIDYDGWNDQLGHLKEKEASLAQKFDTIFSSASLEQLKKQAKEAAAWRQALNADLQELVFISRRAEQRSSDDDSRRWLSTLQVTDPSLDKLRIEEEKGGLLRDSYCWVLDHVDFQRWRDAKRGQLLWIKGDPGKGKTMLLCGIIDELSKMVMHDINISYFFCQATNSRINNASAVLRGLIYMLVRQQPSLITHVRDGRFESETAWVELCKVFTNILEDPRLESSYLLVDALDECAVDLDQLLDFLVRKSSAYSRVKWIVSSRNWPSIEKDLDRTSNSKLCLELNRDTLSAAVDSFIRHKVNELAERNKYKPEIREAVHHHLKANSNGTFLWVALVCRRLAKVASRNVWGKLKDLPPGLDELYKRMLNQVGETDDADLCKSLLSVTMTVFRPITFDELASCIDLPEEVLGDDEALTEIVGNCGSFLTHREGTISLVHQSAKDFLLREACGEIFPDGLEKVHYSIFSKSLQVIARKLQRDIYGLFTPGYPIDRVNQPDPDPLAATRYACVHWVRHLNQCSPSNNAIEDLQDSGALGTFLRQDYLHWLEALALTRSLSDGVASMLRLESLLKKTTEDAQLINRVRDACRFILYHKTAIENQPLQVYASGMVFSPTTSITRIQFEMEEPMWIRERPTMEESWSACLQTLEGHSDLVLSVTFSHGSKLLASASHDRTVKVWDANSGQCLQTLEGHSDEVSSVTFSHDSKLLASASHDRTIKVWDASSGQCLQTLEGHSNEVFSVTFSHDSKLLASASSDNTVKMWDATSGQCLQTLGGHSDKVFSVTFSHNSKLLASASGDNTVKIWDATSGQCLQTLEGHSDEVFSVTFSHDSKLLASASSDNTVKMWDATSGQCLQSLSHRSWVYSVTFSHDSKLLASASEASTVKVWDASNGECLQTFEGHRSPVYSVGFSHDSRLIASASQDRTVKVWDASSDYCLQTFDGHRIAVSSVTFSYDSKLLASASYDSTIKVWDASSGQCLQTLKGHSGGVLLVTFSHDSKLLASASRDRTIKIWDASSGQCLQTLEGHSNEVFSVTFSHDSKLLASASSDNTVKMWDATSGQCLQTLEGHSDKVFSVTFSHDSKLLASASGDNTVKMWDATSGQCLQSLSHRRWVHSVTFSHDSKLLASASGHNTVKMWDATSGQCLQTLHVEDVTIKSFGSTNSCLETDNGTLCLTLVSDKGPTNTTGLEVPRFEGYGITSDGTHITWNSENLLWLPSEYRPHHNSAFAVSLSTICLGCSSGRVLFFTFDSARLPHFLARH
ncbi:uncharacterized protein N7484_011809 [Penicillium longicatenatum]|uniref:uncharacterized protein n=1 Tax=Penicillium longicatenatum TaxID=1561947 RepID=UPI002549986F|nr:uncharacterized protein N7484_011809 [Penicillium longicatenatum]KAJ5631709.1 hypothetical protein N7484_011809 [Penicillium longicatenatum]